MPDARQVSSARFQGRRATVARNAGTGSTVQNALFALAFGFAAALVFGFVH